VRLSVIIPTLNRAETIGGQFEALSRQEWPDGWEVIVADNGCVDRTAEVVRAYQDTIPDLRLIDASQRRGVSYALNVAARHAKGDAFLFSDDDDEVGEGWLSAMGRALMEHPFVACRIEGSKLNPPWLAATRPTVQRAGLQQIPYPPYLPHAGGSTLGVWRSVFEAVGGFDERMRAVQDTDFCVRVQLSGVPLRFVPEAVVHVRFRGSVLEMYRQARGYGESSTFMYKKMRGLGTPPIPHPIQQSLRSWWHLARSLPRLRGKTGRGGFAFSLGYRVGRLRGSLKHRVMAP